jgi:RhoGEF domain
VFANVMFILELHRSLLQKLTDIQRKCWPKIDSFASTLESYLPAFRRYYSEYANHFKFSMHSLTLLCEGSARVQEVITNLVGARDVAPVCFLVMCTPPLISCAFFFLSLSPSLSLYQYAHSLLLSTKHVMPSDLASSHSVICPSHPLARVTSLKHIKYSR